MKLVLSAQEMKHADRTTIEDYGVPSLVLMERAALACVETLEQEFDLKRCGVFCGSGNNGGDGIAVARILKERGYEAEIVLTGERSRMTGETRAQLAIAEHYRIPVLEAKNVIDKEEVCEYTAIVDAMLGIGFHGALREPLNKIVSWLNRQNGRILAVDMPSGVETDTGQVYGEAVHAAATVTFGFQKRGQLLYPGRSFCGKCRVADIGITAYSLREEPQCRCMERSDFEMLPKRAPDGNKGTFGKVMLAAGSSDIYGAAYLAGAAAYRTGSGLVRICTEPENRQALCQMLPEALLTIRKEGQPWKLSKEIDWADVVAVGPGISGSEHAKELVRQIFEQTEKPVVADADALNLLAEQMELLQNAKAPVIVTPHMGEMSRLSKRPVEELKKNPIEAAVSFAGDYHCVCVMKDAATVTAAPDGRCVVNTSGNCGMATGGSGDVLTGVIAALLAQGMPLFEAASFGVFLHGMAGDYAAGKTGETSMTAGELLDGLTECIRQNAV